MKTSEIIIIVILVFLIFFLLNNNQKENYNIELVNSEDQQNNKICFDKNKLYGNIVYTESPTDIDLVQDDRQNDNQNDNQNNNQNDNQNNNQNDNNLCM